MSRVIHPQAWFIFSFAGRECSPEGPITSLVTRFWLVKFLGIWNCILSIPEWKPESSFVPKNISNGQLTVKNLDLWRSIHKRKILTMIKPPTYFLSPGMELLLCNMGSRLNLPHLSWHKYKTYSFLHIF